jgi:alkaline phosphatase D
MKRSLVLGNVRANDLMSPRRRDLIAGALAAPVLASCAHITDNRPIGIAELPINPKSPRIAFGSCFHQEKDQSFWRVIANTKPDLFVMLGDAGYPNKSSYETNGDVDAIAKSYSRLAANADFQAFNARVPILAIWDDNDFGASDAGGDYPFKQESRHLFLDFWGSRSLVARPIVEDGVYCAFEFGAQGERVQIILPDLRYNRSPWVAVDPVERKLRAAKNIGPYASGPPSSTFLGNNQWAWLDHVLQRPAEIRILGSAVQFASEGRGWESWANFPHEKQRLATLIAQTRAKGVVVISGDAHFAETCRQDDGVAYPLWDITSSGLTETWPKPGNSKNRFDNQVLVGTNFGILDLNLKDKRVDYAIRLTDGQTGFEGSLRV